MQGFDDKRHWDVTMLVDMEQEVGKEPVPLHGMVQQALDLCRHTESPWEPKHLIGVQPVPTSPDQERWALQVVIRMGPKEDRPAGLLLRNDVVRAVQTVALFSDVVITEGECYRVRETQPARPYAVRLEGYGDEWWHPSFFERV